MIGTLALRGKPINVVSRRPYSSDTPFNESLDPDTRYMAAIEYANGLQAAGVSSDVIAATIARRSDLVSCRMWVDQIM